MRRARNRWVALCVPLALAGCEKPWEGAGPLRGPDVWGQPPAPPADGEAGSLLVFVENPLPTSLACHQVAPFVSEAFEAVPACEGYSYERLYDEALSRGRQLADRIECRDACPGPPPAGECSLRNLFIVGQSGSCSEMEDGNLARVGLDLAMRCWCEDEQIVPGLPVRQGAELGNPFDETMPGQNPDFLETHAASIRPDLGLLGCPVDLRFKVRLDQAVRGDCADDFDYRPYVRRAHEEASALFERTPCPAPCRKAMSPLHATWTCQNRHVVVEYVFDVQCYRSRRVS